MFDCGDGIYGIDTFYEREGCTSVYIICSGGRCGIIESAANSSLPHLLSALDELGVDYANVDFLALTHVHLDHAGGAGSYMQKFPNAKLIVHPRGAKHMADPTALIEGVCEVYGKSETERMYGEIIPVDKERIISAGDGYVFHIGEKKIITLETPGHAKHHNSYYDESDSVIFSGDAFGVSYSEMQTEKGRWAIPTTSPVQFSPEDMVSSINRMLALNPKKILLTHFGEVSNIGEAAEELCSTVQEYTKIAEDAQGGFKMIKENVKKLHTDMCRKHNISNPEYYTDSILSTDTELNSQGLACWYEYRHKDRKDK